MKYIYTFSAMVRGKDGTMNTLFMDFTHSSPCSIRMITELKEVIERELMESGRIEKVISIALINYLGVQDALL